MKAELLFLHYVYVMCCGVLLRCFEVLRGVLGVDVDCFFIQRTTGRRKTTLLNSYATLLRTVYYTIFTIPYAVFQICVLWMLGYT